MDHFFVQSLLGFFFIVLLLLYVYKSNVLSKPPKRATNGVLTSYPLIGILPDFIKNRHRFLDWTTEILSASPTNTEVLRLPGTQMVITAKPSNVRHILMTNFDYYPKGEEFKSVLEDFYGSSLFIRDGEPWKDHRKKLVHALASNTCRSYITDITTQDTRTRLLPTLERASRLNLVIDLQEIFECAMLDITCKLLFAKDPGALSSEGKVSAVFVEALQEATLIAIRRFYSIPPFMWKIMKFLNLGQEKMLKHSMSFIHKYLNMIIGPIDRETRLSRKDILSLYITSGGITEEPHEEIRDTGLSLILAGKDTIVSCLTWFFWLLSTNPRVENKILAELEETRARHNKSLGELYTSEELHEMHYLHAALSESMRLYPPAPLQWRACISDDVLPDGTYIKKGCTVLYSSYAMGRMEEIWGTDCLEFRPERWLKDGVFQQESPFRFPAFHGGPRMCIGKDLAYIQMKMIAASMIERFVIEVEDNGAFPEMIASLTLLMKDGLPVKVRERRSELKN